MSVLGQVWLAAFCAALKAGQTNGDAAHAAKFAVDAYKSIFMQPQPR